MATRRRKRQSKAVTSEVIKQEDIVNTDEQTVTISSIKQTVVKEEGPLAKSAEMTQEEENQDAQDSQMDIEVKGNQSTVTVLWDKTNEAGEVDADDVDKTTNASGQTMDSEEIISSAAVVGLTDDAPSKSTETNMRQEIQKSEEPQTDGDTGANKSTHNVTVTKFMKYKEEENSDIKSETNAGEQMAVKKTAVNGKRKAQSTDETSVLKKTKLINDGYCLFVGNLNSSKKFEEVKDSLANYFMKHSLLVQDITLDRTKKHAYVDLASEMDLTKALKLNGEEVLDKPMKIEKAKIKSGDKVKVKAKAPAENRKAAKDARCLFLKNVPYNATKEDILKVFCKAVDVRFPGAAESPNKGIAFVEFKNKAIAMKVRQKKQVVKIQDRILIVDGVQPANIPKVTSADDNNNNNTITITNTNTNTNTNNTTKAAPPPNNTLYVSNLSRHVREKNLKNVFQMAVKITAPQSRGKSRGFAFVEFATVADAEKALKSSQTLKIHKREVRAQFYEVREKPEKPKVLSKTLIVTGLTEKTTAETLKRAFEGALSARVPVVKETGVSKRFGFVEFGSDATCKAVKEAMEDCEIDGSKVTVSYAKSKSDKGPPGARGGSAGGAVRPAAGLRTGRGGRGRGRGSGKSQNAVKGVGNKG